MSSTALQARYDIQTILGTKPDGVFGSFTRQLFDQLAGLDKLATWPPLSPVDGQPIHVIKGVGFYLRPDRGSMYWVAGGNMDGDGAPNCYHPDSSKGLDNLANAGGPGNWYGIVTDTDNIPGKSGKGKPYIQGVDGVPAYSQDTVGFYVSSTAFAENPQLPIYDPRRYVNAAAERYIVIPEGLPIKVRMGAKCQVTYNGICLPGIAGDIGGPEDTGELSVKYGEDLGFPNTSPRNGGVVGGVLYEVFL